LTEEEKKRAARATSLPFSASWSTGDENFDARILKGLMERDAAQAEVTRLTARVAEFERELAATVRALDAANARVAELEALLKAGEASNEITLRLAMTQRDEWKARAEKAEAEAEDGSEDSEDDE
jgi:hypothetical protein